MSTSTIAAPSPVIATPTPIGRRLGRVMLWVLLIVITFCRARSVATSRFASTGSDSASTTRPCRLPLTCSMAT